jgi:hypothetical protein
VRKVNLCTTSAVLAKTDWYTRSHVNSKVLKHNNGREQTGMGDQLGSCCNNIEPCLCEEAIPTDRER